VNEDHRRVKAIDDALADAYPDASTALEWRSPFELLVATILSAQCTDARVNMVTPALFARYPEPASLAGAAPPELEAMIRSTGFFRSKAAALIGMARGLRERHDGQVPTDMEALTRLPGVGRKTANVVLGTAFGIAVGIVVDTHVKRVSARLGLTTRSDPERVESDLMELLPKERWIGFAHRVILHGRAVCTARRPACPECPVNRLCPKIGVAAR
jgi:endonuclease III